MKLPSMWACLALALVALVVVWSANPAAAEPIDEGSIPLDAGGMPMRTKASERIIRQRLSIKQLTPDNLEETLRRNQLVLLGCDAKTHDHSLGKLLDEFLQKMPVAEIGLEVARTSSKAIKKRFNASTPSLILISEGGDKVEEYDLNTATAEQVTSHINSNRPSYPPAQVGVMNSIHRGERAKTDFAVLYVLVNATADTDQKMHKYFMRRWDALAAERGKNASFFYAVGDANHFPELTYRFADPVTMALSLPIIVLQDRSTTYKFNGQFSLPAIRQWLAKWENNQLKHYRRSGASVANKPGTLFTLNTDNFELVTKDWTKDVLVLFYGPKCQYSKEFLDLEMPKLLDMVSHVSSLVVAKIDCSVNECPVGYVTGYPTIALFKGCHKDQEKPIAPLGYWEIREADDLFRWLKINSYYSIPKKPTAQPSVETEKAAAEPEPVITATQQAGDEVDQIAAVAGLVL